MTTIYDPRYRTAKTSQNRGFYGHSTREAQVIDIVDDAKGAALRAEAAKDAAAVFAENSANSANQSANSASASLQSAAEASASAAKAQTHEYNAQQAATASDNSYQLAKAEADRSATEATKSENEADRAEQAANSLGAVIRHDGYFDPATGYYPTPPVLANPYVWYSTGTDTIGTINWRVGDMLSYVPNQNDPTQLGQYYRVAGELASGGTPQPLEIYDHLIMQADKDIKFRNGYGKLAASLGLHDKALDVGDARPESAEHAPVEEIHLASIGDILHVTEADAAGNIVKGYKVITEEDYPDAVGKAEFMALVEKRLSDSAGSGVLDADAAPSGSVPIIGNSVENGLYELNPQVANKLGITNHKLLVDGVKIYLDGREPTLAAAPDTAALLSRKDFLYVEVKDVAVTNQVFPKGDLSATPLNWSTMTNQEKAQELRKPENNLYKDDVLRQVQFELKVYTGTSDEDDEVALFTSLGYTKDNNDPRLFHHTDGRKAIPIALVQRLNQGAYHPVWNPSGTSKFGDDSVWCFTSVNVASTATCFTSRLQGSIASGFSGRSDQYKFYDAIYAGQVKDLRLSARTQDTNKLLEDSIRKAVAGKTRGWGKVPFTAVASGAHTSSYISFGESKPHWWDELLLGSLDNSKSFTAKNITISDGVKTYYGFQSGYFTGGLGWAIRLTNYGGASPVNHGWVAGTKVVVSMVDDMSPLPAQFDSLPWVDIIGPPERIAATFPNGCVGMWVADYTSNRQHLNRKQSGIPPSRVLTSNDGASWTATQDVNLDSVTNSVRIYQDSNPTNLVQLLIYETLSNFTAPANNSKEVGEAERVYVTTQSQIQEGNRLQFSLAGTIGKATSDPASEFVGGLHAYKYLESQDRLHTSTEYYPKHTPISIAAQGNNSPAVKTLYTLTEKDRLLYMQYHGCGLKWKDGVANGWGDTVAGTTYQSPYGVIPIINGEGTKTDLNGQTVPTFCHHEQIPIGIA